MASVTNEPIPGGWAERTLQVAERSFQLVLPKNPDSLLDALPDTWPAGDEPLDPYWAQLWPAALQLAEITARQAWPADTRVLELGAGIGVVGLAALSAGCHVTFSDLAPQAVRLALENANRNGLGARAAGLVFDWRSLPELPRFPQVLASDVLYYASEHEALLDTIARTLEPAGECWIGDPGRSAAETFVQRARARGFGVYLRNAAGELCPTSQFGHYQTIVLRPARSS